MRNNVHNFYKVVAKPIRPTVASLLRQGLPLIPAVIMATITPAIIKEMEHGNI